MQKCRFSELHSFHRFTQLVQCNSYLYYYCRLVDSLDSLLDRSSEALPAERLGVDNRQLESTDAFSLTLREAK